MGLSVIILAAGSGKRMVSTKPKILHTLGGTALVEHVVNTAQQLSADAIHVVYGNGGTLVPQKLNHLNVNWIRQDAQLGTGHAVQQAIPHCPDDHQVIVLYGDVPLISVNTLRQLQKETPHNGLGLIVAELDDPAGFGRIVRNELGNIISIVEHKDATENQLKIHEVNTGIIMTSAKHLKTWLPKLKNANKQNEYYLTDIVALAVEEGVSVGGVYAHRREEMQGVNDRWQLANLERYYQYDLARALTLQGVTVMDPTRLDIRGDVDIAIDVTLDVNVILEGRVKIGAHSVIGPNVVLKNVEIGEHVEILANSVIEGAVIEDHCSVGPFARVRPDTHLKQHAKVGNFVEIKKTTLGEHSKANHLTYLGDATIGQRVNIGAGTITCNYDGINKWRTVIGDDAFIGSNTSLIAPLSIESKAYIAGGSTINKTAPGDQLTIARAKQTTVKNWKRPKPEMKEPIT